jgi:hypothetical protein
VLKFIILILLLFIVLTGAGQLVLFRRMIAPFLTTPEDRKNAARNRAGTGAGTGADVDARQAGIENVLPCARCGTYVPESQGTRSHGDFFCSALHRQEHEAETGDRP